MSKKPNMTMKLIIDNTAEPCNHCKKLQGDCECSCSFCERHKRDVPGKVLIGDGDALICKDCIRNAKGLMKDV